MYPLTADTVDAVNVYVISVPTADGSMTTFPEESTETEKLGHPAVIDLEDPSDRLEFGSSSAVTRTTSALPARSSMDQVTSVISLSVTVYSPHS